MTRLGALSAEGAAAAPQVRRQRGSGLDGSVSFTHPHVLLLSYQVEAPADQEEGLRLGNTFSAEQQQVVGEEDPQMCVQAPALTPRTQQR